MTLLKSFTGVASVISRFLLSKSNCNTLNRCVSSQVFPVNERWTRFTKVVHPGNVQMLNMVQGGEIMKFLEASADIAATKYCIKHGIKSAINKPPHPVLVGVERIEITGSAVVGDMLEFIGQVTHATSRSLRISVDVTCHCWGSLCLAF
ncbi:hypothetical protein HELRODRAFT_160683 [Helobdella robusta]|uniref:HotDog ACOT-type domain-containing protein n=1 Tax=Helobdella robusta TaxID=6412 RepID=T1EQL3_HELRO|nr:hypothetical protein HELRODRAFT_160683 [Helobdella robusta]ESO06503.1 hypothetical protein HELRODRAFT_160683 [Helobdella robusta]